MASKRKKSSHSRKRTVKSPRQAPSLHGLLSGAMKDADELLSVDDPLEAEEWASSLLGAFYKPDAPFELREQIERSLVPTLVKEAERRRDAAGLAALYALAAVLAGEDGAGAREAAARMASRGVPRPRWADVIGQPECLEVVAVTDVFDDQTSYHFTFAYPGLPPHIVLALCDENLGGIIKDVLVGTPQDDADPLTRFADERGIVMGEVDPGEAAARVVAALATGDLFLDNHWGDDFRYGALCCSRGRRGCCRRARKTCSTLHRTSPWTTTPATHWSRSSDLSVHPRPAAGDRHRGPLPDRALRLRRLRPAALEPQRRRALHARLPAAQDHPDAGRDRSAPRRADRVGAIRAHQARP